MGVDYTANYGFGVEIIRNEEEDFTSWLEDKLDGLEDIYYFEIGSETYGGGANIFYVCVDIETVIEQTGKYDFIEEKAKKLLTTLDNLGIEYTGVPNLVGGLNIW